MGCNIVNPERDREVIRLYTEEQIGIYKIARRIGMTGEGVRQVLIRHKVPRRQQDWTAVEINYGQKAS